MPKYVVGPDCGTLTVHTRKAGAAAKAGHNLRLEVTRWSGLLDLGEQPVVTLSADSRSMRVVEGTGGMLPLGDEEKAAIPQTIDEEVLKGTPIEFQSRRVEVAGGRVDVEGELDLFGKRRPVTFGLRMGEDGRVEGSARIKQTDWGVKPYSALFGTLKVADEVEVALQATTGSPDHG